MGVEDIRIEFENFDGCGVIDQSIAGEITSHKVDLNKEFILILGKQNLKIPSPPPFPEIITFGNRRGKADTWEIPIKTTIWDITDEDPLEFDFDKEGELELTNKNIQTFKILFSTIKFGSFSFEPQSPFQEISDKAKFIKDFPSLPGELRKREIVEEPSSFTTAMGYDAAQFIFREGPEVDSITRVIIIGKKEGEKFTWGVEIEAKGSLGNVKSSMMEGLINSLRFLP